MIFVFFCASKTLEHTGGFFFVFSLNWQTELHNDPKSWFEVDNTDSMEIAVSIPRESVLHLPSKHCALDSCHPSRWI